MKMQQILEVMTEIAWQLGDRWGDIPRAESRWNTVDIAQDLINDDIINEHTEDLDEVVRAYLIDIGLLEE
jgi:hypothetical protein